jgi:hypothetical protein
MMMMAFLSKLLWNVLVQMSFGDVSVKAHEGKQKRGHRIGVILFIRDTLDRSEFSSCIGIQLEAMPHFLGECLLESTGRTLVRI